MRNIVDKLSIDHATYFTDGHRSRRRGRKFVGQRSGTNKGIVVEVVLVVITDLH